MSSSEPDELLRRLGYVIEHAREAEVRLLDARREARLALVRAKQAGYSIDDLAGVVGVNSKRIGLILEQEEERRQQLLSDPDVTDTELERAAWRDGRDPYTGRAATPLRPADEPEQ